LLQVSFFSAGFAFSKRVNAGWLLTSFLNPIGGPEFWDLIIPFETGTSTNQFRFESSILISPNLEKQPGIPKGWGIKVAFLHGTYTFRVSKN